jgi:hypothetical protein
MKRASLLAVLWLGACASTPGDMYGVERSWHGASYDEAVTHWGTPARSTALTGGRRAYTWFSERTTSRGVVWPSIGIFGGGGGVGVGAGATVGPGGAGLVSCERTLVFSDGRVVDQTWQGDPEYCSTFERK